MLEKKIVDGLSAYSHGLAVNHCNGCIAIASYSFSHLYSAAGQHKLHLDITKDTKPRTGSYPWDVTASRDGSLYFVTCSQYVRLYDVNGLYKGQYVAISPQGRPSDTENTRLGGLVVDANDQVLVGEIYTKYISKHRSDGSHVGSLKVDIAPLSLAVTSHCTIVISDWARSETVHIVDNVGHLLHVIKPPAVIRWRPRGIACYGDIICISNQSSKSICCFSLSGEYLGLIPVDFPSYPICLTFTPNGKKLLVTYWSDHHGIAVYKLKVKNETW